MKFKYLIEEVCHTLTSNKSRSGLTILGIVIGIASVVSMISIGEGAKKSIKESVSSLGTNLITITPTETKGFGFSVSGSRGTSQTLKVSDADSILKNIPYISHVDSELSGRYQLIGKGTNSNNSVIGTTSEYLYIRNLSLQAGDFIGDADINKKNKVAVIGYNVKNTIFGEDIDSFSVIGKKLRIGNYDFKVIGVLDEKGGNGFSSQDDMVFIPLSVMQTYLMNAKYISTIVVQVEDEKYMNYVEEEVTRLLLNLHKIKDEDSADFTVTNQLDTISALSSITDIFSGLLGAIAAISLVVAGIGIMNMMLTSVTERTKEIGLRKAIGAKRKDITTQFLLESVVLTFVGGGIGIIFGWGVSLILSNIIGIPSSISIYSIILAFSVSTLIGVAFGYYPANRASKLSPIEALRYE